LTDGKIVCKNDSYLGFRHGPKSVIDNNTLVVYFFSNNDYVKKYEEDFLHSMLKGNKALSEMGIGESDTGTILNLDSTFYFGEINSLLNEDFLPLCSIIPVHILCFFKAIELGIKPDQPSANGAITRVVEGVNIHPLERKIRLISRK
ncbi:MAG: agaS, partial [Chitinophagaceae bacterium]|nr:agaS [Chitinophagaceae bacterium]